MTRTEAKKVARRLLMAGYRFTSIVETFAPGQEDDGNAYVTCLNSCMNRRDINSVEELERLLEFES